MQARVSDRDNGAVARRKMGRQRQGGKGQDRKCVREKGNEQSILHLGQLVF